jgi:hypothetical protein
MIDMGEGLLRKIYVLIGKQLLTMEKSPFLIDNELSKLRTKIEKKFPAKPDFQKVIFKLNIQFNQFVF